MVTHDPRYAHMADRSIHLFGAQAVSEDQAQMHSLEESGFDVAT
jgi:ABC-type lipoprotein export system ATPase subunit